jgi:hypothetical protein
MELMNELKKVVGESSFVEIALHPLSGSQVTSAEEFQKMITSSEWTLAHNQKLDVVVVALGKDLEENGKSDVMRCDVRVGCTLLSP